MAVHASHAALPYPIKGARFSMLVPLLDADGDPTAQTTPDTEISEDNAAATDAAEEVSATSGMDGMGLITFTGAETDCTTLAVAFKAASGPKTTLATLYPRVLAEVGTGTLSAGSAGGGTLGTLLAYDVTGCFIKTTGGTGGGGTGGADNQVRKIVTYNTGTGAFTVAPNWETTPSTDTTYAVLLPEGVTLGMLKTLNPTTAGRTLDVSSGGEAGVDWANVGSPTTVVGLSGTTVKTATDVETDTADIQSRLPAALTGGGNIKADVLAVSGDTTAADTLELFAEALNQVTGQLDAGSLTDDTITAASIATGALTADAFAANALVAATFAADAFTAAKFNADVWHELIELAFTYDATATYATSDPGSLVAQIADNAGGSALTEAGIADAVWDEVLAGHAGAGSAGEALAAAGSGADAATIADAVWDEAQADHVGVGTFGIVASEIADILTDTGTTLQAELDGIQADTEDIQSRLPAALVSGRIDASVGAMAANTLTASALAADAVTEIQSGLSTLTQAQVQTECEEALQTYHLDHLIASADPGGVVANSSFLAKLVSKSATPAFSSYDNTTDSLEAIRDRGDAAWITATGFSTLDAAGVRTAVGLASANLDTQLSAIVADTNELQTDWANGGRLDLIVDAILDDTGTAGVVVAAASKTGYALSATGLNLVIPADPSAIPVLGTATITQWIAWFAAWSVNEVNSTSTEVILKNSAGTVDLATHAISDDGTTFQSEEPA